jgi:hypothetical protein
MEHTIKYAETKQGARFERQIRQASSLLMIGATVKSGNVIGTVVRTGGRGPASILRTSDGQEYEIMLGQSAEYLIGAEANLANSLRESAIRSAVIDLEAL